MNNFKSNIFTWKRLKYCLVKVLNSMEDILLRLWFRFCANVNSLFLMIQFKKKNSKINANKYFFELAQIALLEKQGNLFAK